MAGACGERENTGDKRGGAGVAGGFWNQHSFIKLTV